MHLRIVLCLAALVPAGIAADAISPRAPLPGKAAAHLDLSVAGYPELSAMARDSDVANFTIDFFDRDHILLTYNPKKVTRRLPECPPTHADHLIHAAVLDVARGKVDVPVAAASLRLGVQDTISGRLGTMEILLPVKAPPGVEQSRSQRLPEIEPD